MGAGVVVVVVDDDGGGGLLVVVVEPSPAVVLVVEEVELDDDDEEDEDVEDEVVAGAWRGSVDAVLRRSRSAGGSRNSPVSTPSTAISMNRRQISAGNEPPVTRRPWTASMALVCPSG